MLDVLRPGRYINQEWNSCHKDWNKVSIHMALAFPDIYEIGMSHIGMRILYGILNNQEDVSCERVFAPWRDMEEKLRREEKKLASLETGKPLKEFDIIGFSLQYEMNFTDVLNIIDLGGVPIFSKDRCEDDPIVIAGGHCCFNPGVMSEFIDVFVIGEAEEVILEIVDVFRSNDARGSILKELSRLDGVYVPGLKKDKTETVLCRKIKDLDSSFFPVDIVVPYIQIVHDRIGIEIMRGCPHRCKFCQATKIFDPLRIRSVDNILDIASRSIKSTGYEEISLLSLSSGDYPYIDELAMRLEERFKHKGVKISLPSLRVRDFDVKGATSLIKKAGLTFAPEAGSERLRKYLNKKIDTDLIVEKSNLLLKAGWKKVKLYFMIGLPTEDQADLDAIIGLVSKIKSVNLSISSFIPKPHSDFEREGMDSLEVLKDKVDYIFRKKIEVNKKNILRIDFHNVEMSRIEAILSRGDEKIGKVVYEVWRKGARLQAWGEYFDHSLWEQGLKENNIDVGSYLNKVKDDAGLSWDFIGT
ncbi:MAG: TIGR03960 family B12-binding radical SAM protein [Candidatus Omnitrophota bacterium]